MNAAGQDAVDRVRTEVLLKRPIMGSALQSYVSKIEMGGDGLGKLFAKAHQSPSPRATALIPYNT